MLMSLTDNFNFLKVARVDSSLTVMNVTKILGHTKIAIFQLLQNEESSNLEHKSRICYFIMKCSYFLTERLLGQ